MPRLIIRHLVDKAGPRAVGIVINEHLLGDLHQGVSANYRVLSGKLSLFARYGIKRSDVLNIEVGPRDTIGVECWVSGFIAKAVHVRKAFQHTMEDRFSVPNRQSSDFIATIQPACDVEACWASILGVNEDASIIEIRKAYIALMKNNHPDKIMTLDASHRRAALARSTELTVAYNFARRRSRVLR